MNGHLSLDELRALVRGRNLEQRSRLVEHCRLCAECGDQLAGMLAVTLAQSSSSISRRRKHVLLATMVAGVILVVAIAMLFPTIVGDDPSVQDQQFAALATTATLPATAVRFHVRLSSLAPAAAGRSVPQIREGGELLAAGEYDAAIVALEREYSAHPGAPLVATYLGIARYLSGDDAPEVARLLAQGVGAGDTRTPASTYAEWYLGNYLLRVGRIDEAVAVLDRVSAQGGGLGKAALATLEEIDRLRER